MVGAPDGTIVFANKAVSDKLGYTLEEISKRHALSLHPAEFLPEAEAIFSDMLTNKLDYCPLPVQHKDGRVIRVETHAWLGKWNGADHVFAVSKNLSEEQESLLTLTQIFQSVPAPMIIFYYRTGVYYAANSVFFQRFNIETSELIGKTAEELNLFCNEKEYERAVNDLNQNGSFGPKVLEMCTGRGEKLYGNVSADIINSQGTKYVMLAIVDLTKQIEIEKRLVKNSELQHVLLEFASRLINMNLDDNDEEIQHSLERVGRFVNADRVYIFSYDFTRGITDNTYEWCNEGIAPEINNLQGIPIESIPDWVAKHTKGEHFVVEDINLLSHEGSAVRAILEAQEVKSLITIPMMLWETCLGFVGFDFVKDHRIYTQEEINLLKFYSKILVNIEKKREREIKLQEAELKAIEASNAKNIFIGKMSHELRNPLNGAWGFINLIKDEQSPSKKAEYLANSRRALCTAIKLANDLLDISKIESNAFEFTNNVISIEALIKEAAEAFYQELLLRNVELVYYFDSTLPTNIIGDFEKLKRIIVNLLVNAKKHAKASRIEIGCKLVEELEDKVKLRFYVKDNGIGRLLIRSAFLTIFIRGAAVMQGLG